MSTRSTRSLEEPWSLHRAGLSAVWKVGLACGCLVSFLSWNSGAQPSTSVIRGGTTLLAFGLIGWGINAILLAASFSRPEEAEAADGSQAQEEDAGEARDEGMDALAD